MIALESDLMGGLFLLIALVLAATVATLTPTVIAIVRASNRNDSAWVVAICLGWAVGLGWILALVYLATVDRRHRERAKARAAAGLGPELPPPPPPPPDRRPGT